MRVVVILDCQPLLLQMAGALPSAGRLPSILNRRQQQRDQAANDRNRDQQLNQRETASGRNPRFGSPR